MEEVISPPAVWQVMFAGFKLWLRSFLKITPLALLLVLTTTTFVYFAFSNVHDPELNLSTQKTGDHWYLTPVYLYIPYLFVTVMFRQLHNIQNPLSKISLMITPRDLFQILMVMLTSSIVVSLGFLFLIIPGFIFTIIIQFYLPIVAIEHCDWRDGFSKACDLVWGNWWRTMIIIAIPAVLFISVALLLEHAFFFALKLEDLSQTMSYHLFSHTLLLTIFMPFMFSIIYAQLETLEAYPNRGDTPVDRMLTYFFSFW